MTPDLEPSEPTGGGYEAAAATSRLQRAYPGDGDQSAKNRMKAGRCVEKLVPAWDAVSAIVDEMRCWPWGKRPALGTEEAKAFEESFEAVRIKFGELCGMLNPYENNILKDYYSDKFTGQLCLGAIYLSRNQDHADKVLFLTHIPELWMDAVFEIPRPM
eukprot:gene24263-9864_t